MGWGWSVTIPLENLVSQGSEKKRRGTLLCFTKSLVSKMIRIGKKGREGGSITIFCQTFFSHDTEKFRRGTLLCFTKSPVSKKFLDRRVGRGGRV